VTFETDAFYNESLAQAWFDEEFIILRYESFRQSGILLLNLFESDEYAYSPCSDECLEQLENDKNYERFESIGYSQGDFAYVYVDTRTRYYKETSRENIQKYINHALWDMPIDGTMEFSFEYTMNTVNYSVHIEDDLSLYLEDQYETKIDMHFLLEDVEEQLVEGFTLSEDDIEKIKKEVNKFGYEDIRYPSFC
jgi:hypothetical protein